MVKQTLIRVFELGEENVFFEILVLGTQLQKRSLVVDIVGQDRRAEAMGRLSWGCDEDEQTRSRGSSCILTHGRRAQALEDTINIFGGQDADRHCQAKGWTMLRDEDTGARTRLTVGGLV